MSRWLILACALWCVLLVYDLDKVFTLSFFWSMFFPLRSNQNGKGCFPNVSSEKTYSLLRFCINLGDIKIFINLYIFIFINFIIGKGGAFYGLLHLYTAILMLQLNELWCWFNYIWKGWKVHQLILFCFMLRELISTFD